MPTSLPVPSTDPTDLLFNAQKLDEIVNSDSPTYLDRMGAVRLTWAGTIETASASASASAEQAEASAEAAAASAAIAAAAIPGGANSMLFDPTAAYTAGTVGAKLRGRVSVADFGIVPDGVTNWEGANPVSSRFPAGAWSAMLQSALTNVVVWPAGYYATGVNLDSTLSGAHLHFEDGAVIGGVFHLISDASPNSAGITSIARASNMVTVNTASGHGWSTGQRVRICNVYVTGVGSVDFNTDDVAISVLNPTAFTYAQVGPNESGDVTAGALTAQRPIKGVVVTGRLTTTDRIGTINAKDCYIERCWVKSDAAQHSVYPGTTCRGAHIYAGTENLHIGELIIDDAGGANTDAALAIDGNAWNPKNCTFGRVHIKDSDCHGAYITGGGHRFGDMRIDGFARGVYTGTLQDSDGATQSRHVKAIWLNRCWDLEIGVLRTSQNPSGSRGYESTHAVVDETGSTFFGTANRGIHIGSWYASNVRRGGISFGDADADSVRCNATVGLLEIRLDPAGLSAGAFALRAVGASGGSRISIDTLRVVDPGTNFCLWTEATSELSIRRYDVVSHSDRVLQARGRVHICDLHAINSGSSSANPVVHFSNPGVAGSRIDCIHLESAGVVTTRAVVSDNSSGYWDIGKLRTSDYANSTGTLWIDGAARWGVHSIEMIGPNSTGVGVGLAGSVFDGYLGVGLVSGFSKGFAKGAATFARCTAVGLNGNGNITPTDLVSGSFQTFGCNGVTL